MDHREAIEIQAVERYLLNELSPEEAESFERHYFECTECALAVEAGRWFAASTRAVFAETSRKSSRPVSQKGHKPIRATITKTLASPCVRRPIPWPN